MNKILILEDDLVLLETLADELEDEGYAVDCAKHGEEVLDLTAKNAYDLYLFDINVPYISGLSLLQELRESGDKTPAIFLTSKHEEQNKVDGFEAGCDDYLVKPFSLLELKLRLKALLKRTANNVQALMVDDVVINLHDNSLKIKGKTFELDKKAMEIFHYFLSNPNKTISYDEIVSEIYKDKVPSQTVVRVHISKINALFDTKRIKNVRGLGYKYEV